MPTKTTIKTFQSSHQNPSKNWVNKNIRMSALITSDVRCGSGGLYVSASNWQDAPTGPPFLMYL